MPSTINANNTTGLVSTADTSGVLQLQTNGTTAVTVDASQNVGVGTTSPSRLLHLNAALPILQFTNPTTGTTANDGTLLYQSGANFTIEQQDSGYINVVTGGTERARIGSSGGLSITNGLAVGTTTIFTSSFFLAGGVLSAGAGTYPLKWNSGTGIVTYDTSSRLVKDNIEDSPYGLAEVLQLKSRKYKRIDSQQNEIGLVADEVLPVMPEFVPLVEKSLFTKDEADTELIAGGVNYDKLTSVLIKAIQEQQALITQLQADVAALKGASV